MKLELEKSSKNFTIYKIVDSPITSETIPIYSWVSAGFPSPAEDYVEVSIDFNEFLLEKPHSTFCVRVKGTSMKDAGIYDNALLIVDRSKEPMDGKIIIGVIDGEFTVKRIVRIAGQLYLKPENDSYSAILLKEGMDFQVWGVVTFIINKV